MEKQPKNSWRCSVCGYIHSGDEPPEICPVCGTPGSDFELYEEPAQVVNTFTIAEWRCINCNYVHQGETAPDFCPVCGAEKEIFEAIEATEKHENATTAEVVIIGGGVAGVSAAESIRKSSPDSKLTMICAEPRLPYYRLNLTRYLAGEISKDSLPLHDEKWYQEKNIDLITGIHVKDIITDKKNIVLDNGRQLTYEKIILTTGSHPFVPPINGVSLPGVFTLRTSEDAEKMISMVKQGCKIIGIGGGILGLETAGALAKQGADITILEGHEWLMPRQLNKKGGEFLDKHIAQIGVKVVKNARSQEILGTDQVTGVKLQDGRIISGDMVVIATGVRPNTSIARKIGIEVNNGIIVDNHLRTSQADILAAGDATEHNGQVYGSWAASQYQGEIAGFNAIGIPTQFGGLPRANTVKALDLDLTSIGNFNPEDGSYLIIEEIKQDSYLEFVFRDGKMQGAILINHADLATPAKHAIESGKSFAAILNGRTKAKDIIEKLD